MLTKAATVACVCCIACSIFSMFAPFGRMKKTVNLILGLFLISSMIIPFISLFSNLTSQLTIEQSVPKFSTPDEYEYENLVLNTTADNLVKVANELLLSEGIQAENIELSIKKNEENSIYISSINIYITQKYSDRVQDIDDIIQRNMSKKPEIIYCE